MPDAMRAIRDEVWLRLGEILAGVETGGGLFQKMTRGDGPLLCVDQASVAGSRSSRGVSRVRLSIDELDQHEADSDWLHRSPVVRCGDWHVHPSGSGVPSPTDVRGWRQHLTENGRTRYIGVVVTRGPRGWGRPCFDAWVVTPDNVVDPINVE
jgi:hypothetical protein